MFMEGGVMASVQSRSFRIGQSPLTATESIALECLKQIASEGREATQDEIRAGIGSENQCGSTATGVINRLVAKGYVERVGPHPYQKAMWLRIVSSGEQTAEPKNKTPHWRHIYDRSRDSTPTLPRHKIVQTIPTMMAYLDKMMREENLTLETAQLTLMAMGMQHREEQRLG